MTGPLRILFVCTANICRSAYANVRTQQLLGDGVAVEVSSAGIHGWVDQPMDGPMAAVLRARGADPSRFRSRRLTGEIVRASDLILTAETKHRDFILDEWPFAFRRTFTIHQFDEIVAEFGDSDPWEVLAEASRVRKPARPSGNVSDPYGRGHRGAVACAVHLDALLARCVRNWQRAESGKRP